MPFIEKIYAYGHNNISCTHNTTIEITKDSFLTRKGTCILGIKASKACSDLNYDLKRRIRNEAKIKVIIKVDNISESFYGFGCKDLCLSNQKDLVFRKSDYICDRTVLIKCSKSSKELDRNVIKKIKTPGKRFTILFDVMRFSKDNEI
ncbi:MAG: DUF371 domain-containing protein [Promethearchaeota archaeon]